MPYPVPPSEPPAIVEYQLPESLQESETAENFSIPSQGQRPINLDSNEQSDEQSEIFVHVQASPLGDPLEISWPLIPTKQVAHGLFTEISTSQQQPPDLVWNFLERSPVELQEINISQAMPPTVEPSAEPDTLEVSPPNLDAGDVVRINSDRQEYNDRLQVVTAEGNALMRLREVLLNADWLQVNLLSRFAVAEGEVLLTNGPQVIEGDRLEYDLVRNQGGMQQAKGQIFLSDSTSSVVTTLPTDVTAGAGQDRDLTERLRAGEPPRRVTNTGGIVVGVGAGLNQGVGVPNTAGGINRLRFESEQVNFTGEGWEGTNVRITNDPYSPPELELRSDHVTVRRLSPEQDEVIARRPRLVFENKVSIPLLRERVIIDRRERDPSLIRFGYDGGDRGGFFAEMPLEPLATNDSFRFSITPQFYIQKAITGPDSLSDIFGFKARVSGTVNPTTSFDGGATFTTLNPDTIEDKTRANFMLRQQVGTHLLRGEYAYRDRIFNGSLGFRTVQQSFGLLLNSPVIPLGKTGINLSYQGSVQYINADTDRIDLLELIRENNRTDLTRFQGSTALSRGFLLWKGKPLPATPDEGIRYTPSPVLPYVRFFTGLNGTATGYSNGDSQNFFSATIGIQGQFGHFSRPWLDYTGWSATLSRIWKDGDSPFLFDRIADSKVLGLGLTQQIYGPIRVGVQTAINLDTNDLINTDLTLEYSRRSYGLTIRYNPDRELGSLLLRISDFNWLGGGEPFSRSEVRSQEGGVQRTNQEI
jgi:lipopolysaccharide export system protein LptA